jgi:hypothetical protein
MSLTSFTWGKNHDLSVIRTRDLWVSGRQCYQLSHWGHNRVGEKLELKKVVYFFDTNHRSTKKTSTFFKETTPFWSIDIILFMDPKLLCKRQNCRQICSIHFHILSRNLYGRYPKDSKFQKSECSSFPRPKITKQKRHQICCTVKLVEQNMHLPILSRNL